MRQITALLLILVLAASLATCFLPLSSEQRTIIVPDDYPSLNAAIASATDGDVIRVKSGVYTEQTIEINKTVSIMSEVAGAARIVLHPPTYQQYIFGTPIVAYANPISIIAEGVKLSGLHIQSDGGIVSASANGVEISNCAISGTNYLVLSVTGDGCQITGNQLGGVTLVGSNQTFMDNTLSSLSVTGTHCLIERNTGQYIELNGSYCTVNRNTFSSTGDMGGGAAGILLLTGDHNVISNNTVTSQGTGIAIGYTGTGGSYNMFLGNKVQDYALWGILMGNGKYNLFYGNLVANNRDVGHDGYGLALGGNHQHVNYNLFFGNAFVNNSVNFGVNWNVNGENSFDNGTWGNYWDDYLARYPDAKEASLGTGSIPYLVYSDNTQGYFDNHPLLNQPPISGAIPALPEPWASVLQGTVPIQAPAMATPEPTAGSGSASNSASTGSSSLDQSPNKVATPNPDTPPESSIPTTTLPASPVAFFTENSTFLFAGVVLAVIVVSVLVGAGLLVVYRRRGHAVAG